MSLKAQKVSCSKSLILKIAIIQTFEKRIFDKTKKRDDEILLLDGSTICYKSNVDLIFFVVGPSEENELLISA